MRKEAPVRLAFFLSPLCFVFACMFDSVGFQTLVLAHDRQDLFYHCYIFSPPKPVFSYLILFWEEYVDKKLYFTFDQLKF